MRGRRKDFFLRVSLTLALCAGPTAGAAQQAPPGTPSPTIPNNRLAQPVSPDGRPVLAFPTTQDYCKYVRFLLERAGTGSASTTRLADGFAVKLQPQAPPVTVLGTTMDDCDGAEVDFYRVKLRNSDRQPVYILRSYLKQYNANRA